MKRTRIRRGHWLAASAGLVLAASAMPGAAQGIWYYTLGVEKEAQQAQFCDAESDVRALAVLFREKGARAGYFAIEQIYDCATGIATFTPLETLERVIMETRSGTYPIHFVRVRMQDGETSYLVTTRDVKEQ